MTKKYLTTFEVGELCQVYHTTVINWVNKGQLKAHTTPGRHRRIQRDDLLKFMKEFNIPIPHELANSMHKVLVVDDDLAVLSVLKKAFAPLSKSIQLQTTTNGVEALVLIGKDVPDMIILDVIMPEMDGIQVCRTLKSRSDTKDIQIVAITGQELSEDQENFLKENVEELYKKPFSPVQLVEKTCALLGVREWLYETK